jgi:uncharacterized membrane protein
MPTPALEWLHLAARWIHVIAAIMWIGDSFLFMWMDRSLVAPSRPREGDVVGELWMVHSGGFYEVVKRRVLAPGEMPRTLHWFMWEAYTTWITGMLLLGIVYYFSGGVYLIDRSVSGLGLGAAIGISLGLLVAAWLVYDALWRSPLARSPALAAGVGFALIVATSYGLTRIYPGRAAFIQLGAMLGTIMVTNVAHVIIPAQRAMVAATRAGRAADAALGVKAKQRSTHNHYLTLPVLFTMLSNHFPSTYGSRHAWLVLALLVITGTALKYVMNYRARSHPSVVLAGAAALVAAVALTARPSPGTRAAASYRDAAPVAFAEVRAIIERRCLTCHATHPSNPSFPQPPSGIVLEDPRRIQSLAPRILVRAVETRTMPLGNLTGMTEEERATLGAWIAQGARIDGARKP